MPVSAETLAILMSKGLAGEDLLDVVRSIDADGENATPVKTKRQERNARYYQKRKGRGPASENVLNQTSEQDALRPQVSPPKRYNQTPTSSPSPSEPEGSSVDAAPRRDADPKSILAEVLPEQTAADVVAHRKALRKPLTAGAARALGQQLAAYSDPVAGAEAMLANGWQGFKPEWMVDSRGARAGPQPRGRSVSELARMGLDDPDIFDDPRSDPRHSAPEVTDRPDQAGSGFAGRLSEPAARAARRGALIDH